MVKALPSAGVRIPRRRLAERQNKWIAFCGPIELTPAGVRRYGAVLDLPVEFHFRPGWDDTAAVVLLNDNPDCERLERKCIDLFESLAGYCTDKQYRTWFREVEPEK